MNRTFLEDSYIVGIESQDHNFSNSSNCLTSLVDRSHNPEL
jgi:hypothetical protein